MKTTLILALSLAINLFASACQSTTSNNAAANTNANMAAHDISNSNHDMSNMSGNTMSNMNHNMSNMQHQNMSNMNMMKSAPNTIERSPSPKKSSNATQEK